MLHLKHILILLETDISTSGYSSLKTDIILVLSLQNFTYFLHVNVIFQYMKMLFYFHTQQCVLFPYTTMCLISIHDNVSYFHSWQCLISIHDNVLFPFMTMCLISIHDNVSYFHSWQCLYVYTKQCLYFNTKQCLIFIQDNDFIVVIKIY
jgi:hypothetical protein